MKNNSNHSILMLFWIPSYRGILGNEEAACLALDDVHGTKNTLKIAFTTTVNPIRANHYNLISSLARMNIVNSPKCKCDSEDEVRFEGLIKIKNKNWNNQW